MIRYIFFVITIIAGFVLPGCEPERDDDFHLPGTPVTPEFSVEMVPGDSNRVIVRDLSPNSFQRIWDLPGGMPKNSSKSVDTVFYSKAGEFTIILYASEANGSGTASSQQKITIFRDAPVSCSPKMSMLTGGCSAEGKCWIFTHAAGAVKVGPLYDDFSWYTSPVNGLQAAQYDDRYCFTFENQVYQNRNNGESVDPWNGYQATPYDPGIGDFIFIEGTGNNGRDQILIPDDQFMGVWDSDNLLDVVSLTDTELIVRGRQRDPNGVPLAQGWFELVFEAQ